MSPNRAHAAGIHAERTARVVIPFDVDNPPRLIGADVMASVFGIGVSAFYKNAKRGLYDVFKVNPALGPKCYSGILLARYLKGEPLYVPTFGAKRKKSSAA